jgi:hypothetical protein
MADDEHRNFAPGASASKPAQTPGQKVGQDPETTGDLGSGTPANVDIHNLGQPDNPEQDWGEASGEAATFSSNNSRKGLITETGRGQGAKTRKANKDIVSRRS